jgi:hypothetical protein
MRFEKYKYQQNILPQNGKRIIANYGSDFVTVYQAFNNKIADYAIKNQKFGGSSYSFNRMTWFIPGFMWRMYRSGWASKENQERILAIKIDRVGFLEILKNAVHTTFYPDLYESHEIWQLELQSSEIRLQWDPDHSPNGTKLERNAIQLGLKGEILKLFNEKWIKEIVDITPFVMEQKTFIDRIEFLEVPFERELSLNNYGEVLKKIDANWDSWNIYLEFKYGSETGLDNFKNLVNEIRTDKEKEQLDYKSPKWGQYFKPDFWKLKPDDYPWLLDCFANGEYEFLYYDRISEDTAKLICRTWSAPYGGFEAFRDFIEGFGYEIIEVWE